MLSSWQVCLQRRVANMVQALVDTPATVPRAVSLQAIFQARLKFHSNESATLTYRHVWPDIAVHILCMQPLAMKRVWRLAGPPPKQVAAVDPALIDACAARLEAVTAAALRSLPGAPAAYLDPGQDPGSGPGALALQQGPALARLAHAHADGAALGAAAALLRLRCDQLASHRVRDIAADAGAAHSAGAAEVDDAGAVNPAGAAGAGSGGPARAARGGGGAAAEPDQAQGAGPLLGALGAQLRRAAAFLTSGSAASAAAAAPNTGARFRNGVGSTPGSAPVLPLAAALRAVALLEAGGRALGSFCIDDPDLGHGAAEGFPCAAAGSEAAAEAGVGSPRSAAFEALLALHLRLLRSLVPPPEVHPHPHSHTCAAPAVKHTQLCSASARWAM